MSVKTKLIECPSCFEQMDGATSINSDQTRYPRPGDFSICVYCGALLRYDDVGVTLCSEEELNELDTSSRRMMLAGRDLIKSERWQKMIKKKGLFRDR